MKRLLVLFLCICGAQIAVGEERDSLLVMFQNLENFFDFKDDGSGDSDRDFSSGGFRRWTKKRFYTKCNAVAKTILWTGDRCGRVPDIVGFAEVENAFVLRQLLSHTVLRKLPYRFVHYDSADHRGIDVALLYNSSTLTLRSSRAVHPDGLQTRDILLVEFDSLAVLVNHHPSKFGGEDASRPGRMSVMKKMLEICDSLAAAGCRKVIAMGDFNDTPDGEAFTLARGRLENKGLPLFLEGEGSLKYDGKWELIDNFLVCPELSGKTEMKIEYPPFLMTKDSAHGGMKPLRTYSGPRWLGGISDHLPVVLYLVP